MSARFAPLPERSQVSAETFREEILPAGEPVVMRGLVSDWEAVRLGGEPSALADWLRAGTGRPSPAVNVMRAHADQGGRFFYRHDDMRQFNFQRVQAPFGAFLDRLLSGAGGESIYMGSTAASELVPARASTFALPHVPPGTEPRLWIGNQSVVSTHRDTSTNIACVVAGERTFSLLPPEQLSNLYPGPMEHTMAGPQVSLVDLHAPDLTRYPRFVDALDTVRSATLGPGDAIFIPALWWHDVRALSDFGMLVNFWWDHRPDIGREPLEAFVLSMLAVRELPAPEREAWRAMFDYFVFKSQGEPMAHLPDTYRGVLGPITEARAEQIWKFFRGMME